MKTSFRLLAIACIATCGTAMSIYGIHAEDPALAVSAEEAAIRKASQEFASAFEKGDATVIANFFTENGEYVDEGGEPIQGREAIRKAYESFFANRKNVKVESTTDQIRFLGPGVAIEEGLFSVRVDDGPTQTSHFSTLFVRENDQWRMAMVKEWTTPEIVQPSMADLEWLIGTWKSGDDAARAETTYTWLPGRAFIQSKFTVETSGENQEPSKVSGSQIIGVNPATGMVQSWTFGGEGGVGEATWSYEDGRWVIRSVGHLPDGSVTTATNLLTQKGANEFSWRSVERSLNGESLPDLDAVVVQRAGR